MSLAEVTPADHRELVRPLVGTSVGPVVGSIGGSVGAPIVGSTELDRIVDAVMATLRARFVRADRAHVEAVAYVEMLQFRDVAVRQFVPILVQRAVIQRVAAGTTTTEGTTP